MKKLFAFAAALVMGFSAMATEHTIDLSAANLSSDSKWYEVAEVGGVTNKTGNTWSSADFTCTPVGAKTGSNNFSIRCDVGSVTKIEVHTSSTSNRTIGAVKTGSSLSALTALADSAYTKSGSITKETCDQILSFEFKTPLAAGTFVNITMSGNCNVHSVVITSDATPNPRITSLTIAGVSATIDQTNNTITAELPYGTTLATALASVSYQLAGGAVDSLTTFGPGYTTVTVTNGTVSKTYTLNITINTTASSDATLSDLKVNGTTISKFKADSLNYTYSVAYVDTVIPTIAATLNDASATMVITQVTSVPGTATVVVTAQDGTTTKTYTIAISRLAAEKKINELMLDNWYFAYSPDGNDTVYAHYLAGTPVPAIYDYKLSAGATLTKGTNSLTVTGADGTTATYPYKVSPVTPYLAGTDTIIFDGTEDWVKSPYGWEDNSSYLEGTTTKYHKDGYKFSKTDNDFSREWAGKTHLEIYLTEADTVILIGSKTTTGRDIRVRVNDVKPVINAKDTVNYDKANLAKGGVLVVPCHRSTPFCLSIRSAQTGGDGALRGILVKHMAAGATACEENNAAENVQKVMINGQIYIIKNGVRYNVLGAKVE